MMRANDRMEGRGKVRFNYKPQEVISYELRSQILIENLYRLIISRAILLVEYLFKR